MVPRCKLHAGPDDGPDPYGGSSLRLRAQMKESVRRPDQSITRLLVKWGTGDKLRLTT